MIIRYDVGTGVMTPVAGSPSGTQADGYPPLGTKFSLAASSIAVTATGDLLIGMYSEHKVRFVDMDGVVTTVAGTGSAGNSGDTGPGTDAALSSPQQINVYLGQHVLIADQNNSAIRLLWQ